MDPMAANTVGKELLRTFSRTYVSPPRTTRSLYTCTRAGNAGTLQRILFSGTLTAILRGLIQRPPHHAPGNPLVGRAAAEAPSIAVGAPSTAAFPSMAVLS